MKDKHFTALGVECKVRTYCMAFGTLESCCSHITPIRDQLIQVSFFIDHFLPISLLTYEFITYICDLLLTQYIYIFQIYISNIFLHSTRTYLKSRFFKHPSLILNLN